MLATLLSATIHGLDGRPVRVEVDVAPGLPGMTIVGLADTALQEARERVRGAIRNSGYAYPPRRITVNLAPADLRKAGASLDLAIAIGILVGSEQVRASGRWALVGELSLGGEVRPVPGLLPMVASLARRGVRRVVVPAAGMAEAALVPEIDVLAAADLAAVTALIRPVRRRGTQRAQPPRVELAAPAPSGPDDAGAIDGAGAEAGMDATAPEPPDLSDVRGQLEARRALEIALAGGHNLMLVGPPGVGKTLLARTIPGLLPPLDDAEARQATVIASVAGQAPVRGLVRRRPFRAPHHTVSYAAMVGGGPRLSPGEVTMATDGVLFLDELAEFDRDVLEALRGPLEDGRVAISRVGRAVVFPSRFQLVAAMNPCPCGHLGDARRPCACRPSVAARYATRISGPLRDRIDLWVSMARVEPDEFVRAPDAEGSAAVKARIAGARACQVERAGRLNGTLSGRALRRACRLDRAAESRLIALGELDAHSSRGLERILRVARTIADLEGAGTVSGTHLGEAARFRTPAGVHDLGLLAG